MLQEKLDKLSGIFGEARGKQDAAMIYMGAASLLNEEITDDMCRALTLCAIDYLMQSSNMIADIARQLRNQLAGKKPERTQ